MYLAFFSSSFTYVSVITSIASFITLCVILHSGLKFEEFVRILLELIMKINLFKLYFRNFLFEV